MKERKYDQRLNIKTEGVREWEDNTHYYRYEATPYEGLERLFSVYNLNEKDSFVDFGCGRGRVSFFVHDRFNVPVRGVEANDKTFAELIENKEYYKQIMKSNEPINFEFGLAESFFIEKNDNVFFFFNPFSIHVFKKVVFNILKSFEEHKRVVDIILYYPSTEYKQFLAKKTRFKLFNKIRASNSVDKRDKFLIYRLSE